jgi:hypothetical protein
VHLFTATAQTELTVPWFAVKFLPGVAKNGPTTYMLTLDYKMLYNKYKFSVN